MNKLKVAAIQMKSSENKERNLKQAAKAIAYAAGKGCTFIVLPEVFNFRGSLNKVAENAEFIPGYSTRFIAALAKKYKVWILIGSIMEKTKHKPYNTSVLINPTGRIKKKYRKIHLFDIKLKGKEILESQRNQPGLKPVLVDIGKIKIGLSICYDLRFPELYRIYAKKGAEIICIPSSFTKPTGEVHWHTLTRTRAIENLAFVIAPNQAGLGSNKVMTYGHSLIVDPWGKILQEGPGNKEAVLIADLDMDYLYKIRKNLPALEHRKLT